MKRYATLRRVVAYADVAAKIKELCSFYNPGLRRFYLVFDNDHSPRLDFPGPGKPCFPGIGKIRNAYPLGNEKNGHRQQQRQHMVSGKPDPK